MSRWVSLAICALGCGHPAPSPATPPGTTHASSRDGAVDAPVALDEDYPRLAGRSVGLYQDLQRALTEAGQDCAAATTKVNAVADRYADVIAANVRVLHAGHEQVKRLRAALDAHAAELDAAAQAIVQAPAMKACAQDAAFAKAMDRLGEPS